MNNVDYTLSILSSINKPYGYNIDDDEIAEIFSKLAMRTIKDKQLEAFNNVIYHERFSMPCHLRFFYDFFDNKNVSSIDNLNQVFSFLLETNYFDFSAICHGIYKRHIPFFKNKDAFLLLLEHLNKNCLYFDQIANNYEYSPVKTKNKKEEKFINDYMEKSKKYEVLSEFLNNGPEGISWSYGSLEDAFKEIKSSIYGNDNNIEIKEKIFDIFSEINNVAKNRVKKENAMRIIALGLGFSKIGAIGKKINIKKYKKSNSIVVYDPTYYVFDNHKFNNPYINFKECLEDFNRIKNCGFSDIQMNKIQDILIKIRTVLIN